MQTYLGVKYVKAEPVRKDGREGYKVIYPDGYESWSPKNVFDSSYFQIDKEDQLTPADIDRFIEMSCVTSYMGDEKTTILRCGMPTGFVDWEFSSCVDSKNYNHEIGHEIALKRVKDKVWAFLGFALQWGKDGLHTWEGNRD